MKMVTVSEDALNTIKDLAQQLQDDANRYRWLRELPNADSLNVKYMGSDLDMIIDASMNKMDPA